VVEVIPEAVSVAPATPATDRRAAEAVLPSHGPLASGEAEGNWWDVGMRWETGGHPTLCPYVSLLECNAKRAEGSSCLRRHVSEQEMLTALKNSKGMQRLGSNACLPGSKDYDSDNCKLYAQNPTSFPSFPAHDLLVPTLNEEDAFLSTFTTALLHLMALSLSVHSTSPQC
jgi:hypothetical protein